MWRKINPEQISCQDCRWFSMRSGLASFSQLQRSLYKLLGQDGKHYQKPRPNGRSCRGIEDFLSWWTLPNFHGGRERRQCGVLHERWGSALDKWIWPSRRWLWLIDLGRFGHDLFVRRARPTALSRTTHPKASDRKKSGPTAKFTLCWRWYLEEISQFVQQGGPIAGKHGKARKDLVLRVRYGDFTTPTKRWHWREANTRGWAIVIVRPTFFKKSNR